ncbi:SGNH/GDSL hydrolase family protein [Pseudophaeobacter leonis]|uniref:SGNH/GDSL hydrolase family protein n=1 Tax=Pseudophaeobacter leonis TaxID=1144477 RepID=UPI0009F499F9|nr:SGNH/GDSL hydrolase family protein [Pseudophaeobacter leonis]
MLALDQILRLPLLPLLALQAITVRRRALILPEPRGPRQGQMAQERLQQGELEQERQLRVLIAGDSSAAGVGVSAQSQGLSGQLAAQLSAQFEVHWRLEATTGHQTRDTITRLQALPKQQFDVIILALGVNDVTHGTTRTRFYRQQSQLMQLLLDRFEPRLILACGVPQMQHFPALPQPLAWVLGRQSARLDNVLAALASEHPAVAHMPFQLPQDPALAAADGYHPSAQAYRLWALGLGEKILDHLAASQSEQAPPP